MHDSVSTQRQAGDTINLALGHPSPELLPLEPVRKAAAHRLSTGDRLILQYGLEPGDLGFRRLLGSFLGLQPERLFVSAGISGALDLICTSLTAPGDTVLVEDPTYFLARKIFGDHHLRVVGTLTGENGVALEELERRIRHEKPRLLYLIPSFQNPTGVTLAREAREQVLRLCREHNVTVIADEAYHLLGFDRPPPPSFAELGFEDTVVTLGSFSKILGPGLRLGWVHAAPRLLEKLALSGLYDSGGGANPFAAAVVRSVLELNLMSEHLNTLRSTLAARRTVLYDALTARLGAGFEVRYPEGGYFVWARSTVPLDIEALTERARRHGVLVMPGSRASVGGAAAGCLRLSFSYYDAEYLREGVERIAAALTELR